MLLRRFYDSHLAQASYLVGCAATGEALVLDPTRDVAPYLDAAAAEGLRITGVTETHIHADFVSGTRELAAQTGATPYLSGEGGADWRYGFADADGATIVKEGDAIRVGNIRLDVRHTPGHTPEHLAFVVTDTAATDIPMGVFTGDFVFVGDVGRPDLLERAAKIAGTMESGARDLFRSLQRFKTWPDYLQIWPAHGAGSACGKALGAVPSSTIGYERIANWAFPIADEATFVAAVLAGQPDPPKYFAHMKAVNRDGPAVLGLWPQPRAIDAEEAASHLSRGAQVVDTRPASAFAVGHLPGTLNIPMNRSFATWAGWLLDYRRPLYLIVPPLPATTLAEAVHDLTLIGFDNLAGYVPGSGTSVGAIGRVGRLSVEEAAEGIREGRLAALDVRARSEWDSGHLPGVSNIPLGYLADQIDSLSPTQPLVLHCQTGARSAIAASLLQSQGFSEVYNLEGGIEAWKAAGGPVERAGTGTGAGAAAP